MSDGKLSLYESADWGARTAGSTRARRDAAGTLFIDEVQVESVTRNGQFSVLRCVDGSTKVVLTSFLRLVPTPSEHR